MKPHKTVRFAHRCGPRPPPVDNRTDCNWASKYWIIILMSEISQILKTGSELFLQFVDQIEHNKISDISIRRALKKYEVKNLKINNVTPLRAKKMYALIIPKYHSGTTHDKSWLENQRRLFIWCTLCYLHSHSLQIHQLQANDFEFLRSMFPQKELQLIKFQIYSLVKKNNKNCGWQTEEDHLLKSIVQKEATKSIEWSTISKQFFSRSKQKYFRNAKQCRERWLNRLDPNKMKGKWQPEQDIILLEQVLEKGKKWSKIVSCLQDKKNQHMVKNRYKSLIHRKQKNCKTEKIKENQLIRLILKDYEEAHLTAAHPELPPNDIESNYEGEKEASPQKMAKQEQCQMEAPSLLPEAPTWPILVEPSIKKGSPKEKEESPEKLAEDPEKKEEKEVELCGSKADKQFVNSLFFNISTPAPEDSNRLHSIIMEARSPAGSLFLSPFPAGCWTPTLFLVDDTQQSSPQNMLNGFSNTVKSTFSKFLVDDGDKKN